MNPPHKGPAPPPDIHVLISFKPRIAAIIDTIYAAIASKGMTEPELVYKLYKNLQCWPLDLPRPPHGSGVYPYFCPEATQATQATQDLTEGIVEFAKEGVWYRQEYRWVKIVDIKPQREWKPKSRKYAVRQIKLKKSLVPVDLRVDASDHAHQYTIMDGIHRILALRGMGYTYVLAKVDKVKVHQQPSLPPEAAPHYRELERMALLFDATTILGKKYLTVPKNVYLVSLQKDLNVVGISILRDDRDDRNVEDLPPDCTVVVLSVDGNEVNVTATIFSQEFQYLGTYLEVSTRILNKLMYQNCTQI